MRQQFGRKITLFAFKDRPIGTGLALLKSMRNLLFLFCLLSSISSFAMEYREYSQAKIRVNKEGNLAVIKYFHDHMPSQPYLIVDKKAHSASLYSVDGDLQISTTVKTFPGDELTAGGAGIYLYAGSKTQYHYGKAEKNGTVHALFAGKITIPTNTSIYVLPASDDHRFRIRNHLITFNASRVLRDRNAFNYSPFNEEARNSRFTVDQDDDLSQRYVKTLQDEKVTLMKLLGLENDEYNMLAEFAFGVLAPETNFGRDLKYRLKQTIPIIVSISKGNGFDTDENSRGPTQIKTIPPVIAGHYNIDKGDLKIPENAAVATLGFAADLLKEIRNRAPQHAAITEETLQDYMYYLYQGRRAEIKNSTATPDANISIRRIREAIEKLHIEE